jgi:hypothetical protein
MNAPAQKKPRFSLTRLLGDAKPAAESTPEVTAPPAAAPVEAALEPTLKTTPPPALEVLPQVPLKAAAAKEPETAPPAAPQKPKSGKATAVASDEKHSKKKRSYSVDMGVCDDLEVLAWYQGKSSSAVVEDLLRQYLGRNRQFLEKAIAVRNGRKDEVR